MRYTKGMVLIIPNPPGFTFIFLQSMKSKGKLKNLDSGYLKLMALCKYLKRILENAHQSFMYAKSKNIMPRIKSQLRLNCLIRNDCRVAC